MKSNIEFQCRVNGRPIGPNDSEWQRPLPMDREAAGRPGANPVANPFEAGPGGVPPIAQGDYFHAAISFLLAERAAPLRRALAGSGVDGRDEIRRVMVDLVKHGALYHPSRVVVARRSGESAFVLNAALSGIGKSMLEREFSLLDALGAHSGGGHLPRVYAIGKGQTPAGAPVDMFLGEWFDGFHEFHLSPDGNNPPALLIWDEEDGRAGRVRATPEQAAHIHRRMAFIHTWYLDVDTASQIFPWHNGAGDFVVSLKTDPPEVRLISVRGYFLAVMEDPPTGPAGIMQALMLFLIDLSIRIRLDRLDGVGETGWAGDAAVAPVVDGFLEALAVKPDSSALPAPVIDCFAAFMSEAGAEDMISAGESLIRAWPATSDRRMVLRRLKRHGRLLHECLGERISRIVSDR